jgi:glycosyltransferase involved in cell wall biosynthesis
VLQTAAWHRGMGKYSLALLGGIAKNSDLVQNYDVYCLFSDKLKNNDEAIKLVQNMSPSFQVIYAKLSGPEQAFSKASISKVQQANKQTLNELVSTKFKNKLDSFLILALYLDEACPVFPDIVRDKLLVYYDSIPYLYPERYDVFAGFFDHFYMPHTATVYEATKLLAISKTVVNDLHIIFGFPEQQIFAINGASISRTGMSATKPQNLQINKDKYILMPTGQELRKNNLRAVRAFAKSVDSTKSKVKLVITSHFTEQTKDQLTNISEQVIFTDNVNENEMAWLYQNCLFVLFPSEYEGLGLPMLEAAEMNKPIACSDIAVFREMSTTAFTFFDPLDIDSIEKAITNLTENLTDTNKLPAMYADLLKRYTWTNTAINIYNALTAGIPKQEVSRKKIAIFCPDPSGFSAIGKVIVESHPWYSKYFDITYYFDRGPNHQSVRPNPLPYLTNCLDAANFKHNDASKYDALVYHVGNSEYHMNIIQAALVLPGYIVLHDTYLNGAYKSMLDQHYLTSQRVLWEDKLDKLLPEGDNARKPRSRDLTSLINNQKAIITHSEYASKAVQTKLINKDVITKKINLPVDAPIFPSITHSTRKNLNIAFAGIIARIKGTDLLDSVARSEEFKEYNINVFGYNWVDPTLVEPLRELPNVKLINNPSDHAFQKLLSDSDIMLNVRQSYMGETSLTTLEAMRYGVVVLVRNFGWYSELPDKVVVKVNQPVDAIDLLREIINDKAKLEKLKTEALKYIIENHSHQQYAQAMYDLIKELNPES